MKDLLRMRTSLSEEVQNILNAQIKIEALSSANYLAMAAWCDTNGYEHSAEFFYKQADEERGHMLKIFKFVCEMGAKPITPEVTGITQDYTGFREVFEAALEMEIGVSQSVNRVIATARKMNDFATENFMQWFVKEQIEEEYIARRCVELFELIGEEGTGRFMIDKEISKVAYKG
jgi:ferritin